MYNQNLLKLVDDSFDGIIYFESSNLELEKTVDYLSNFRLKKSSQEDTMIFTEQFGAKFFVLSNPEISKISKKLKVTPSAKKILVIGGKFDPAQVDAEREFIFYQ